MMISQVIFSGFELELYAENEWAMMYWYLSETFSVQRTVLDELYSYLLQETNAEEARQVIEFIDYQREYIHGLLGITSAMRDVSFVIHFFVHEEVPNLISQVLVHLTPRSVQPEGQREQANFRVRFKWAFVKGYSDAQGPDEDRPILGKWRRWRISNEVNLACCFLCPPFSRENVLI